MTYRIREVDTLDEEIFDSLVDLHRLTFFDSAPIPALDQGIWWIGYKGDEPVSFAAVIDSDRYPDTGYFHRVGVLPDHCGNGLQVRHMRIIEACARREGLTQIVSDTTDNPASANNFIKANYRIFVPEFPWAFPHSIYWTKTLWAALARR